MKRESQFQANLIKELRDMFPGCIILKNDSSYIQGIPDLLILHRHRWAALECKRSLYESYRPNQEFYLEVMDQMSFASMICPENREAVLYELQQALSLRGITRVSKR